MAVKKTKKKDKMSVGGQAVIEGVMMRSKNYCSVAVRRMSNKITVETWPVKSPPKIGSFRTWPVIRGVVNMIDSMATGFKAIDISGEYYEKDLEAVEKKKNKGKKGKKNKKLSKKQKQDREKAEFIITLLISAGLAILLFVALPWWVTKLIGKKVDAAGRSSVVFNAVIVSFKLIIFFLYVSAISMIGEMKRFFQYHGAEHKTIYAYENGKSLTYDNIKKYSTLHARCGTAFIVLLMLISLFIFVFLLPPHYTLFQRLGAELLLILPLAGISYELLKLSDKFRNNPIVRIFIIPGLAFQKITTKEPDKGQIEVAAKSLAAVLALEKKHKKAKGRK